MSHRVPLRVLIFLAAWRLTYPSEKWWSVRQLGWWHSQLNGIWVNGKDYSHILWKNKKSSKPPTKSWFFLADLSHEFQRRVPTAGAWKMSYQSCGWSWWAIWSFQSLLKPWHLEIVDLPMKRWWFFQFANIIVYQRVLRMNILSRGPLADGSFI